MDSDSWIQLILLILLLIGAAYCAASEIAFASVNKIRLRNLADGDDKRAEKALYITDNFDKAISTILIGNNITHIGFAAIATLISTNLWGIESVKYTTIVSTIIVFLFSEMIPKNYGKSKSTKFSIRVSNSLYWLMRIFTPLTIIFTSISNSIAKLFPAVNDPAITEEEFYDIIETANEEGILDRNSQELIESALWFDDMNVEDVYTSIKDVVAIEANSTEEEIIDKIKSHKYSRIPIFEGEIGNIVGILSARKLIKHYIKHSALEMDSLVAPPYFVKVGTPIDTLLKHMSSKKQHMAIVIDDSNHAIGVVTVEDILEELVGEIWDEDDIVNEDFAKLGGERYEVSGSLFIHQVLAEIDDAYCNFADEPKDKKVSDWVSENLGKPIKPGDRFIVRDIEVTVLQVSNSSVSRVVIKLL